MNVVKDNSEGWLLVLVNNRLGIPSDRDVSPSDRQLTLYTNRLGTSEVISCFRYITWINAGRGSVEKGTVQLYSTSLDVSPELRNAALFVYHLRPPVTLLAKPCLALFES